MISKKLIETGVGIAGGLLDEAVGNGMEAGFERYKSYEDFRNGYDLAGVIDGYKALYHGAMAGYDAYTGQ